jgi:hypothetical protein
MNYSWASKILCNKEKRKSSRRTVQVQQRPQVSIPRLRIEKQAKSAIATGDPAEVVKGGSITDESSNQRLSIASFVTNLYPNLGDEELESGSSTAPHTYGGPVQVSETQGFRFDETNKILPEPMEHRNTPLRPSKATVAQLSVSSTTRKPTKSYLPLQEQLGEALPTRSGHSTRELSGSTLQDLDDEAQRNNSPPFHSNLDTHRPDTKLVQTTAPLYATPMLNKDPKVTALMDIFDMAGLPENRNPFATYPRPDRYRYLSSKRNIFTKQLSSAGNRACDMAMSSPPGRQLKLVHTQGSNDPNINPQATQSAPLSSRIAK